MDSGRGVQKIQICGRSWVSGTMETEGYLWTGELQVADAGMDMSRGQGRGVGRHRGSVVQKYDIVINSEKQTRAKTMHTCHLHWRGIPAFMPKR